MDEQTEKEPYPYEVKSSPVTCIRDVVKANLGVEVSDIVSETGGPFRGAVREFNVNADSNTLVFRLEKSQGSQLKPLISGIELVADDF